MEKIKYQALIDLKNEHGIKKFLWTDEKKFLISKKTLEEAEKKGKCSIISIGKETESNINFYSRQKIIKEKLSYEIGEVNMEVLK